MRFFLIIVIVLVFIRVGITQNDTVRVEIALYLKDVQYEGLDSSSKGYSLNGKRISYKTYLKIAKEWEIIHQKIISYMGKYCLFVDKRGRIRAEGRAMTGDALMMRGPYKEYYKNGKLKMEGTYSDDPRKNAIHEWKIYNRKGKIKCACNFDDFTKPAYYQHYLYRKALQKTKQKPVVVDICKCES